MKNEIYIIPSDFNHNAFDAIELYNNFTDYFWLFFLQLQDIFVDFWSVPKNISLFWHMFLSILISISSILIYDDLFCLTIYEKTLITFDIQDEKEICRLLQKGSRMHSPGPY